MHLAIPHSSGLPRKFLRHYERLLSELEGLPDAPGDKYTADSQVLCDRNFNVACETGIRYPTLVMSAI